MTTIITWPEVPTCHEGVRSYAPVHWHPGYERIEDGKLMQSQPWRSCSFCGSIHPEDLVKALEGGTKLGGSDWKYGWPHKFYMEMPNPQPEREFVVSTTHRGDEPIVYTFGKRHVLHGKWYNEHLKDLDDAAFAVVAAALKKATDIEFARDEKGIKYAAPCVGYQKAMREPGGFRGVL